MIRLFGLALLILFANLASATDDSFEEIETAARDLRAQNFVETLKDLHLPGVNASAPNFSFQLYRNPQLKRWEIMTPDRSVTTLSLRNHKALKKALIALQPAWTQEARVTAVSCSSGSYTLATCQVSPALIND